MTSMIENSVEKDSQLETELKNFKQVMNNLEHEFVRINSHYLMVGYQHS